MVLTSALANKLVKKLQENIDTLYMTEESRKSYRVMEGEEPLVPNYSYTETEREIKELNDKIRLIKHYVNVANTTQTIEVDGEYLFIDEVLVVMSQLNKRKNTLARMKNIQPKERVGSRMLGTNQAVEYAYTNFDVNEVERNYKLIDNKITNLQIALDKFNQTYEFDVPVEI